MHRCGIVILAAGASARMGVAKQLLEFEGSSLLLRAVRTALASDCRPVVVVLGARAEELRDQLSDQPVRVVLHENWAAGMGGSIKAGLAAIGSATVDSAGSGVDAILIFLCDQPLVSTAMLNRMRTHHFEHAKAMTAAFYGGTLGTPAIFSSRLFDELLALEDAQGGKTLLMKYPDEVTAFALPEAETDVDCPEDFRRLTERGFRD